MPDNNQVCISPIMFFTCIIVSILIGAAITYFITLVASHLTEPKKTMVLRDEQGRLKGIIEA